jgi:hypothetical protein
MIETLIHNAYWLVYVGTILEGETALLLGALTASQGLVDIFWVIIVAFAGATTGDQISYQVFRRFGPAHGQPQRNIAAAQREGPAAARRPSGQVHHDLTLLLGHALGLHAGTGGIGRADAGVCAVQPAGVRAVGQHRRRCWVTYSPAGSPGSCPP